MNKGKKLYEGKAKIIYETKEKGLAIQHFKDDATAFNNQKKATVEGKGVLNNRISEHILQNLNQVGIKNHLIKRLNMREQLIKVKNFTKGKLKSSTRPKKKVWQFNILKMMLQLLIIKKKQLLKAKVFSIIEFQSTFFKT